MGATSWTQGSQSADSWLEAAPGIVIEEGFAPFGFPIPLFNAIAWADATTTFVEGTQSATTFTEGLQSATSWTEGSL